MLRFNLANACELHKSLNPTWTLISTKILRDLHYRSITDEKAHKLVCWNCLYSAKKKTFFSRSYVSVKGELQPPPPPPRPPGNTPGIWLFWKFLVQIPPYPSQMPFFGPHHGGFVSSRVPTPGNLPCKAKKLLMPGGQPGGGLGAGGIDWFITEGHRHKMLVKPPIERSGKINLGLPFEL